MSLDLTVLKTAARRLRTLGTDKKNSALRRLATVVIERQDQILSANNEDLHALKNETASAFRDRLTLNPQRIATMAESLRQVADLPDPVGEVVEDRRLANGLHVRRVRAPLGVIFMIFESRPNVILEAFSLAFKSSNAILLRGGSESKRTAAAIYQIMREVFAELDGSPLPFLAVENYDRALIEELLQRSDIIDVAVPRGGDQLIAFVQKTARMPIIKNDRGLCHTFVDASADVDMAIAIVVNAKMQRPGVCNALETVLIHQDIAAKLIPRLQSATQNVEWRVDAETLNYLTASATNIRPASAVDWDTEYLDLIMNCRVVRDLDEALLHIDKHGSRHSEAIITTNEKHARRFQEEVDAAAVYWNASTRFTDGFELGLGGELGISTQKLHVRGPVGLRELTTPRWVLTGSGQIRF